jgi:hypothetical protein
MDQVFRLPRPRRTADRWDRVVNQAKNNFGEDIANYRLLLKKDHPPAGEGG